MSAPPEVVFNTATDPHRLARWLPEPLCQHHSYRPQMTTETFSARWSAPAGWTARLQVDPIAAGGAMVWLELEADPPGQPLDEIVEESLASLALQVEENLTPG